MKIGDEVYVHGYVDEIRQGVVIIRNNGGYFGTVAEEILLTGIEYIADRKTEPQRTCDNCGTPRDKCVYCIKEDKMWTPKTEPQTMPIKKTMTGTHREQIEYAEAEMVVEDESQTERGNE